MKKLLVVSLVFIMFAVVLVPITKASTLDDIMAKVVSLQKQVGELQSQLTGLALSAVKTIAPSALPTTKQTLPTIATPTTKPITEPSTTTSKDLGLTLSNLETLPRPTQQIEQLCLPTTSPWVQIVSPNGGESYHLGTIPVTYKTCNLPHNVQMNLELVYNGTTPIATTPVLFFNQSTTASFVVTSALVNSEGWQYGNNFKFRLRTNVPIQPNVIQMEDYSDNWFVIDNIPLNSWVQKADFGAGNRYDAVGFSIGNKGYIGTGINFTKDFWEYNSTTNIWTQKANFGGIARQYAVGFSIGTKGYIGTGSNGYLQRDFWEYNPTTNLWIQKANFGGANRLGAVGFSIGSKGYIGTGLVNGDYAKDFWEYTPGPGLMGGTWLQKADFGGTSRVVATGFSIGNKGYIGTGSNGATRLKDFWEYNPTTNAWTQKADFGGTARQCAVGFSIGDKGYIGTGYNETYFKDFWEYNPTTNSWIKKADFGGHARDGAVGFSIGNKGYIGTGINYSTTYKDFWEYNP